MKDLLTRFSPSTYDNLMETLMRLRQLGSVEEHKVEFKHVSNRLRQLMDNRKLSCFLTRLKDEIIFKMFNLHDLLIAFSLAKIQEKHVKVSKKVLKGVATSWSDGSQAKMYLGLIKT